MKLTTIKVNKDIRKKLNILKQEYEFINISDLMVDIIKVYERKRSLKK